MEIQKKEFIKQGLSKKNIRLQVGPAANPIKERPVFQKLIDQELKENKKLSITEIAKVTKKSRNTISKVLKNELN